jgi:2-iminobutanoate/2-iminopropanoate deaminase
MEITRVDPPQLKEDGMTMGVQVTGAERVLYITGQPPIQPPEYPEPPSDFETQARIVWQNLLSVLAEAGMTVENLVRVATYLARRADRDVNSKVRQEFLAGHQPSLTIAIAGLWDESWLLEIDAIAVA